MPPAEMGEKNVVIIDYWIVRCNPRVGLCSFHYIKVKRMDEGTEQMQTVASAIRIAPTHSFVMSIKYF